MGQDFTQVIDLSTADKAWSFLEALVLEHRGFIRNELRAPKQDGYHQVQYHFEVWMIIAGGNVRYDCTYFNRDEAVKDVAMKLLTESKALNKWIEGNPEFIKGVQKRQAQ